MILSKKFPLLSTYVLTVFFLCSCVTTRQQLNEENGITEDSTPSSRKENSVKSEDLAPTQSAPSAAVNAPAIPAGPPSPADSAPPVPTLVGPVVATTPAPQPIPAANGSYSMEEIRAEMARLSGKVEELEHEKKLKENQSVDDQKKLQEKIELLEKQLRDQQPQGPAIPEGKTPFEAGKDAYFTGRYEEAIVFMDRAIMQKETGKEAEEAFYIQGESFFKLKNYQKAIVNYSKFPEKFPKSAYHSKALLRIAECFDAMGLKEDAKAFYQNLVDQFPKTAEGKLAKKRLNTKKK